MINILSSSFIPCIVLSQNSEFVNEFKGSLFPTDTSEYCYKNDTEYYQKSKTGWGISSKGYATYTIMYDEYKIIFTGMKVKGISSIHGKDKGIPLYINDKATIENYVVSLFNADKNYLEETSQNFQNYSHELKKVVTDIYHKILEIKDNAQLSEHHKELCESITALTNMLSVKSDIMAFLSNPDINQSLFEDEIGIHKKFLKIVKCLTSAAKKQNTEFNLHGESYKRISRGPAGFEIIPYLLIENAIKYSPSQYDIDIYFEDLPDKVVVQIQSIGPEISNENLEKIFKKGYRDKNAQKATNLGQGIGLFIAKSFIEKGFNGKISVKQQTNEILNFGGISYKQTNFTVSVPC